MSDKPAPTGTPGTAWNDPKVPGLRLRYWADGATWSLSYRTRDTREQRNMKLGTERALTLTKAREIAKDVLHRVAMGEDPARVRQALAARPTLKTLRDSHVEHSEARNKGSWSDDVRRYWDRHILPAIGEGKAVADVTEADIASLHHKMRGTPAAANRCAAVLSKAFNLAETWGMRPRGSNPVRVEKYPERKRKRMPEAEEAVRLLIAMEKVRPENPFFIGLVELLLFTGARLNEIMTAKWEWVKPDGLHLPDSKTGEKVVPLSELARDVLESIPRLEGNPYIIPGRKKGRHMVNVAKPWARLMTLAKIDKVLWRHDLRRFFASAGLSMGGVSLDQLGGVLGHMSASTTKRYAYLLGNTAEVHADAAARAVKSIMTGGGKVTPLKTNNGA